MNLAELQRYFARVATSTSGPPADLGEVFRDSPHLSAHELMRIYNRGYHYRLLGVLAAVFERTRAALTGAEFERLGLLYLVQYPSEHPAVERVGRHFADFLARSELPDPAIVDLARLEWARLCALVAADALSLAANTIDIARFPTQVARFVPALMSLRVRPRALALFAGAADEPEQNEPRGVVVYRRGHAIVHEAISPAELAALARAAAGQPMSAVCAAFETGNDAADVARAFSVISSWFERGWIAELQG